MQVVLMYHHNINNCPMAVRDPHHPQSSPHPLPSTSLLFLHSQQPSMLRLSHPPSFPPSRRPFPLHQRVLQLLEEEGGRGEGGESSSVDFQCGPLSSLPLQTRADHPNVCHFSSYPPFCFSILSYFFYFLLFCFSFSYSFL